MDKALTIRRNEMKHIVDREKEYNLQMYDTRLDSKAHQGARHGTCEAQSESHTMYAEYTVKRHLIERHHSR